MGILVKYPSLSHPRIVQTRYNGLNAILGTTDYESASCIGALKFVDSVRTGRFVPGVWRVNPAIISTQSLTCSSEVHDTGLNPIVGRKVTSGPIVGYMCAVPENSFIPTVTTDARILGAAAVKAYSRAQKVEADVAQMLAEFGETIRYIINPFSALSKLSMKYLRKKQVRHSLNRNWTPTKDTLAAAADLWLQYRYAARPLYSDVMSLIDLANTKRVVNSPILRKTGSQMTQSKRGTLRMGSVPYVIAELIENMSETYSISVYVGYRAKVQPPLPFGLGRTRADLGFDSSQLAGLAWELTPWSFVIDWFLGVGDWIEAQRPKPGLTLLGSGYTVKLTRTTDISCQRAWQVNYSYPCPSLVSRCTVSETSIQRLAGASIPAIPVFNPNFLNIKRTLDLLSLVGRPIMQLRKR